MRTITVFHNIATDEQGRMLGMLDGYVEGHPLVPVASYCDDEGGRRHAACERAFHLLNVGHDPDFGTPDERAVTYREQGNRSLSVGDVVQVTEGVLSAWFSCDATGFSHIAPPAWFALGVSGHGTTSLTREEFSARTR